MQSLFHVGKIDIFRNEHEFLSNFYVHPMDDGKGEVQTLEHAFQGEKTLDAKERHEIRNASTPGRAKRLGKKCTLRKDWETIKIDVMYHLLLVKFQDEDLQTKLLATNDALLIEGNTWGDQFWGVCDGKGKNWLGELLMRIREELREKVFMERY